MKKVLEKAAIIFGGIISLSPFIFFGIVIVLFVFYNLFHSCGHKNTPVEETSSVVVTTEEQTTAQKSSSRSSYLPDNYWDSYYDDSNDYHAGFSDGEDKGYAEGLEDGQNEGYEDGYNEGNYSGYRDGYNEGYEGGYYDGYRDAYIDMGLEPPDDDKIPDAPQ